MIEGRLYDFCLLLFCRGEFRFVLYILHELTCTLVFGNRYVAHYDLYGNG